MSVSYGVLGRALLTCRLPYLVEGEGIQGPTVFTSKFLFAVLLPLQSSWGFPLHAGNYTLRILT